MLYAGFGAYIRQRILDRGYELLDLFFAVVTGVETFDEARYLFADRLSDRILLRCEGRQRLFIAQVHNADHLVPDLQRKGHERF